MTIKPDLQLPRLVATSAFFHALPLSSISYAESDSHYSACFPEGSEHLAGDYVRRFFFLFIFFIYCLVVNYHESVIRLKVFLFSKNIYWIINITIQQLSLRTRKKLQKPEMTIFGSFFFNIFLWTRPFFTSN